MQFTNRNSEQIRAGEVNVSFRNWRRPHVKVGGVYRLRPHGAVRVTGLRTVRIEQIDAADAACAGFACAAAVAAFLRLPATATVTRVAFELVDEALLKQCPQLDVAEVLRRLHAKDRRSASAWTASVLTLIRANPATRAADLAPALGWDTPTFKTNVRKLKALGLTQSLPTGYRLTALGEQVASRRGR